jgi:hypothetical protein
LPAKKWFSRSFGENRSLQWSGHFAFAATSPDWIGSVLLVDFFTTAGLRLDDLVLTPSTAVALLVCTSATAACPRCGSISDHVHSRYRRTIADLPCPDRAVALRLVVRKFRCARPDCPQDIFCERLPGILKAHARSTTRLTDAHRAIGFALGSEAGARLAEHLDMPTSPDTLLRRIKDQASESTEPIRYIGVDDWALRKGQRYGTILIDLERGRVIDILEGRDGEALKAWLKEHPGVEVITRDRWVAYAEAAAEAAPQAKQVADRWHLLKNLREAIERLFEHRYGDVKERLQAITPAAPPAPVPESPLPVSVVPANPAGEAATACRTLRAGPRAARAREVGPRHRPRTGDVGSHHPALPARGAVPGLVAGTNTEDAPGQLP